MSEQFIVCENLVKIYQVAELEMVALQGLNLLVDSGELMGIIGASGSGKSTLMNVLGGLDRPTAGKVSVDGQDLLRMSDRQLNRYRLEKVGFVWQQSARNLVPYLNAIQNVTLPMTLYGTTGKEKSRRAEELLELVGLQGRTHHKLQELSGGEQQRVAIAVALANNPTLLLGDEPTGEVDSVTAQLIYDTFRMLTRELGITALIVSHDPEIARHVDRVVRIRDGMLASETRRALRAARNGVDGAETDAAATEEAHEEHFEELVVLDRAGRVHIPQEFLEEAAIRGRARLEVTEDGILIRRVDDAYAGDGADNAELATPGEDAAGTPAPRKGGFWRRFRRDQKNGEENDGGEPA